MIISQDQGILDRDDFFLKKKESGIIENNNSVLL